MTPNLIDPDATEAVPVRVRAGGQQAVAPAAPRDKLHIAYVDSVRALAALYVMCVHILSSVWANSEPHGRILKLAAKFLTEGHFAIVTFIVVSGFCLMLPVTRSGNALRGGVGVFLRRRYIRIAPPFYAAAIIAALLLMLGRGMATVPAYYSPDQMHLSANTFFGHLFLIPMWWPRGGALPNSGTFWTITVEFVIYLWFPLMLVLWRRLGPTVATAAIVLAAYVVLFAVPRVGPAMPMLYADFILGAMAASIAYAPTARWLVWRERIPWYGIAFGIYIAVIALTAIASWKWVTASPHLELIDLPVGVACACVLIGASRPGKNPVRDLLQARPLVFIGAFSYSLYLLHYQIGETLMKYLVMPLKLSQSATMALTIFGVLPAVLVLTYGFHLICERPFHNMAKRIR